MDIHRCRFVHYPPSTINALAFSHSHIADDQKTAPPRLAVGRNNGDIEIWNPLNGSWLQETIIRGGSDRSIDGLVWTQDPNEEVQGSTIIGKSRLFSIGYSTTVTEWDLEKGRPLRQASGNHGDIWCLAAQPPAKDEESGMWPGQHLIAGCMDGTLVLYSTKDEDLQLQKLLIRPSSKKAKIISVTFQNRNIVMAGCSDSTIRIYDIRNGSMLRSMTLGVGPAGGPKEILIWSIKALPDGTIVSGDSTGELRVWDGKTYTFMQRIKAHKQDILSLATSADGSAIVSGGMDRRTVVYKRVGKGRMRWAEVSHRRYHNHDVKTMASFEGRGMSCVVSGGPDAAPTVLPLSQFGFENQRALPFLPQESIVQGSPRRRLLISWWNREVHIWRLTRPSDPSLDTEDSDEERPAKDNRKLVAKILIKGEANITSASISADGNLLVVSTASDIKVFQLKSTSAGGPGLKISKVDTPPSFTDGARLVHFSPDGKWLSIVRLDSNIAVARIISESSSTPSIRPRLTRLKRVDRRIEKHILLGGLGSYDRTVTQAAFSSDSRILAVSDLAGYIDAFVLEGAEDFTQETEDDDSASTSDSENDSGSDSESEPEDEEARKVQLVFGQRWIRNPFTPSLPKLPSTPVVLSFRPGPSQTSVSAPHPTRNNPHPIPHDLPASEDRLLLVTATSEIFEFEVLKGALSEWSRRNPSTVFPEEYRVIRDVAKGVVWDNRERIWVWGVSWLWMFDLSKDLPDPEDKWGEKEKEKSKKRKRKGKEISTGAGSAIPDDKLGTGISRKMQRVMHEEIDETRNIVRDDDAMDIDDDENNTALELLRRENSERKQDGFSSWHTSKYRPILGVTVIGEDGEAGPEIALVERPIWEVELPPRYYGGQEWEKNGIDEF